MVGEDRHAKVDQLRPTIGRSPLEAVELGHRSVKADLEPLDLTEPAVGAGLADAFSEVLDDLDESGPLAWIDLEDGAANAGVFVLAGGPIGAPASPQGDLAQLEVLLEVAPLLLSGLPVFLDRAFGPAAVEEAAVGADQIVLKDREVCLSGRQSFVSEDAGGAGRTAPAAPG
ncbi:hypothetical protein [Streptomyces sp. NBC_01235]|uniref:hypothetical protein n=1 Tax=Streptomyces sp. NBC_01235 TaxID=2903788 RepID=UPI002E113B72|nr:hypothetical protein OG289_27110 [Streptomyces sp. NBC_01235]